MLTFQAKVSFLWDPYTALLFYMGCPDHKISLQTQGYITSTDLGAEMSDNVSRGKRKIECKLSIKYLPSTLSVYMK